MIATGFTNLLRRLRNGNKVAELAAQPNTMKNALFLEVNVRHLFDELGLWLEECSEQRVGHCLSSLILVLAYETVQSRNIEPMWSASPSETGKLTCITRS